MPFIAYGSNIEFARCLMYQSRVSSLYPGKFMHVMSCCIDDLYVPYLMLSLDRIASSSARSPTHGSLEAGCDGVTSEAKRHYTFHSTRTPYQVTCVM